ncbi:MbnP family protein [Ruegeria lacuscaerulensis]|uniref:MbnP family protein n=1 Tax=Ruegeria lacuscaerulensis TaxID=55218 RepID=UPI0014803EC8|nr:MbnP family protein [Ruegeria lacuscaerulensis]
MINLLTAKRQLMGAGLGLTLWSAQVAAQSPMTLEFHAMNGDAPFIFDEFVHSDPIGGEPFRLRDFRFFLSNVVFSDGTRQFAVPESYYLIRFDGRSQTYEVTIPEMPLQTVSEISFAIGLDAQTNGSITPRGDVDPNSRMAWNWEIGYKFVLAEGALRGADGLIPLVYHVGFDENMREQSLALNLESGAREIAFDVDIMALFDGETRLDLSALPTVKMDRDDASALADNFAGLVKPRK